MFETIIENESIVRLAFFIGTFVIMAIWEWFSPRRQLARSKLLRWSNNLSLVLLNTLILRLLFPIAATGVAIFAGEKEWGLLNNFDIPLPIAVITSIIIMDLTIYMQHRLFHLVPVLWRIHRLHHADPDFDVTTGARFHPIEMILSMLIKFGMILLLGAPVIAVIIFEIILNTTAMFNHSNVRINLSVDKYLRMILVTPDMHRVHHSVETDESNTNFGFSLPWWDRLFGTYREQPVAGHENMPIGLDGFNKAKQITWLSGMLKFPFVDKVPDNE